MSNDTSRHTRGHGGGEECSCSPVHFLKIGDRTKYRAALHAWEPFRRELIEKSVAGGIQRSIAIRGANACVRAVATVSSHCDDNGELFAESDFA